MAIEILNDVPEKARNRPLLTNARVALEKLLDDMESNPGEYNDGTGTNPNP